MPRPPIKRRRKVKKKVISEEEFAATADQYETVEAGAAVKLPQTAGEPDAEAPGDATADAKELAGMIKLPSGTVAKAATEPAVDSEGELTWPSRPHA